MCWKLHGCWPKVRAQLASALSIRVKQYTKCLELGQPEVVYHSYSSGTQSLSSVLAMEPEVIGLGSG